VTWDSIKRIESSDANVAKYVFTKGDAIAESVLYKYPTYADRTVICCSTQSGCPVGCRFCGAGDSFVRSLTAAEIASQPLHLLADTSIDPTAIERLQIMFMSMGEPMLNLRELTGAIRFLHRQLPEAALLVSTSGPRVDYGPFRTVSVDVPTVGLQFSVHESTDEARDRLIPFKAKLSLADIALEGETWHFATGRRPFFNYCAHEGNVSDEDVERLFWLFDPDIWEATISVVCERDESVAAANARQRELAAGFQQKLLERGYSTRMFDPAGQDDIGGGCGQLWFVQDWMRNNPKFARPSIGRSLPVVHAPRACGGGA
jgi:23S rRNA (adenine2503-C2)-methyltransferase